MKTTDIVFLYLRITTNVIKASIVKSILLEIVAVQNTTLLPSDILTNKKVILLICVYLCILFVNFLEVIVGVPINEGSTDFK